MILVKWTDEMSAKTWPTMRGHYLDRTDRHISLVQKYCKRIKDRYYIFPDILRRGQDHDQSKFTPIEFEPYVLLTWRYKCKDEGMELVFSDEIEDKIRAATEHHVRSNDHHPEYWAPPRESMINPKDRDKPPEEIVDATHMSHLAIAELVADWCAMSEERGNTPREWADKNVGIRWKFDKPQRELIYGLIDSVWEDR